MNSLSTMALTRTALLLAATLVLQGLRLVIPIPPQVSMFLIGSLVNACFVIAVLTVHWRAGVVVALVTPVFAWLEGMLPFPLFIVPVAFGNSIFVIIMYLLGKWKALGYGSIYAAAGLKAAALYGSFYVLFSIVAFPDMVRHAILFTMSWPQLLTGWIGGTIGILVSRRIKKIS